MIVLGLFGTALLYGDGIITPAISVLSAAEGIEVAAPPFKHYVLPLTLLVLSSISATVPRRAPSRSPGGSRSSSWLMWRPLSGPSSRRVELLGARHRVASQGVTKQITST